MRYLMIMLLLFSSCSSTKNTKPKASPLQVLSAYSQQSTLGFQNTEGSSSFTSYVITLEKNDNTDINAVYIHGTPFLFHENKYEGKTLITIQDAANSNENEDLTLEKITTTEDGVIVYTHNNKEKQLAFSITKKPAIQNK